VTTYADPPPPTRARPRRRRPDPEPPQPVRKDPLWAKLCIILGAAVMVISGGFVVVPRLAAAWFTSGIQQVAAIPDELRGANIDGPINVLLLGMDQRNGDDAEDRIRADSIIILHIPASHDQAFMISIPRDAEVAIPDYPPTKFKGYRDKINAAFAGGAVGPDGHRDPSPTGRANGAALTMKTLSNLVPGGLKFDGVAIINFDGFLDVLEAIGGVHMCVDVDTHSIHYTDDGVKQANDLSDYDSLKRGKHYPVGCYDMQAWEALDYSRQRHNLPNGDYDRQRHQQQFIKAMAKQALSKNVVTNPAKLDRVLRAAGKSLIFDGGGHSVVDWGLALRNIHSENMTLVKLPGRSMIVNGQYQGEALEPSAEEFFRSVTSGTVAAFMLAHPDYINKV
jgi:LCP family protein required for cell wall assembly